MTNAEDARGRHHQLLEHVDSFVRSRRGDGVSRIDGLVDGQLRVRFDPDSDDGGHEEYAQNDDAENGKDDVFERSGFTRMSSIRLEDVVGFAGDDGEADGRGDDEHQVHRDSASRLCAHGEGGFDVPYHQQPLIGTG